jgi:hypothetical protein
VRGISHEAVFVSKGIDFQVIIIIIIIMMGRSSSPGRAKNFLFSLLFRPVTVSTQHPSQWVPGALSPGVKQQGPEADYTPPTSSRSRKHGPIRPFPHTSSWRVA